MRVSASDLPAVVALDLTADGRPVAPVTFVELTEELPRADVVAAACQAAASASRVVVGVCKGPLHSEWSALTDALSLTLVERTFDNAVPKQCVAVDNVEAEAKLLSERVTATPVAATTLTRLLGITCQLPAEDGLAAESLAYSMLLAGSEFGSWLARRSRRTPAPDEKPPVLVNRTDDALTITLNRPARHNAYSASMRDALVEALDLALFDSSIARVELLGAGPSFCSGGDLDEFGTTPDPATAHIIRMERSVARRLHELRDRLVARVHGACIGAGTEFAAFCATVVADDDTYFELPEVAMGLVPGAGGTVSVCRRIGQWRTAYLALTGARVDVEKAMAWSLVDRRADV